VTSPFVTVHVWRVPARALPRALWRMAVDRWLLPRTAGVRFARLLGTGDGRAFGPLSSDLTRWATLTVWDGPDAAAAFDTTRTARGWRRIATGECRVDLRPVTSRGRWSGREPFAVPARGPGPGPVAALTRARLAPRRALTFWRAIPPVAAALPGSGGLRAAFGIGEAPVGWQGTFSVWRSNADLVDFAYRHPQHTAAVARTATVCWYAEDLFARFSVLTVVGDRTVLDWTEDLEERRA